MSVKLYVCVLVCVVLQEENELERRETSLEEIKARHAELAKVKALMFYQQIKQHRINKIKSKAYRSLRKKQKLRRNVIILLQIPIQK